MAGGGPWSTRRSDDVAVLLVPLIDFVIIAQANVTSWRT